MIGVWLNHEFLIGEYLTLNSEIGLEGGVFRSTQSSNEVDYLLYGTLALEPIYYFNLIRRQLKNKKTNFNSGSFISPELVYISDVAISNSSLRGVEETVLIIPKIGMRRFIWNKVIFEMALGYVAIDLNNTDSSNLSMDLRLHYVLF